MSTLGQGTKCYILDSGDTQITDTVARVQKSPTWLTDSRAASLQLITEDVQRRITGTGTDAVVAGTHTWTVANGAFAATDVGGRLIVIGSVSNDGSYNIASRTSATVIVTDGVQVNETFTASTVFIVIPPGTLDGAWKIEVSNDFSPKGTAMHGQSPTGGAEHWTDITALFLATSPFFTPAIAVVAHGTAGTRNQFVQIAPGAARALRVTFTPSAGAGRAIAIISGGSY